MGENDDCEWVDAEGGNLSVVAAFVADCYDVDEEKVRTDVRHYLKQKVELAPRRNAWAW